MRKFSNEININVLKSDLLLKLSENRASHAAKHAIAMINWRLECKERLNKQLEELHHTGNIKILSVLQHSPEDMTKAYDDAIAMLTWHTESSIGLDQEQFSAFIQDDWEWTSHWRLSNSKYLS